MLHGDCGGVRCAKEFSLDDETEILEDRSTLVCSWHGPISFPRQALEQRTTSFRSPVAFVYPLPQPHSCVALVCAS
jgi:hypothetical protein